MLLEGLSSSSEGLKTMMAAPLPQLLTLVVDVAQADAVNTGFLVMETLLAPLLEFRRTVTKMKKPPSFTFSPSLLRSCCGFCTIASEENPVFILVVMLGE
uniref:Uncharacterized protein n=2 Tax=Opuntia streptacantha TaxID=393608 RepID=A0A7C8YUM4_OPUST